MDKKDKQAMKDMTKALKGLVKDVKRENKEPSKAYELGKEATRRRREEEEAFARAKAEKKKKKK